MQVRDFLTDILPDAHWYAAALMGQRMSHQWFASKEQFVTWVLNSRFSVDAYFAFAGFFKQSRRKTAAEAVKTFVLDVDLGKEGGYQNKDEALQALGALVQANSLPTPTWIIDSGGGYHLYWVLGESVPAREWVQVAEGFKQFLRKLDPKLAVDVARVADPAGLLRIPGTHNFKYNPPAPVSIAHYTGKRYTFDNFKQAYLQYAPQTMQATTATPSAPVIQSDVDDALLNRIPITSEDLIEACPAFAWARQHAAQADYNEWWATVQLCAFLEDGASFAHVLSSPHPEYSPTDTAMKFEQARRSRAEGVGPFTCERFIEALGSKAHCASCPFRGQIKSPIVAGRRLRRQKDAQIANDVVTSQEVDIQQRVQAALRVMSEAYGAQLVLGHGGSVCVSVDDGDRRQLVEVFPRLVVPVEVIHDAEGLFIVVDIFDESLQKVEQRVKLNAIELGATASHNRVAAAMGLSLPAGSLYEKRVKRYIGAIAHVANKLHNKSTIYSSMGTHGDVFIYGNHRLMLRDGEVVIAPAYVDKTVNNLAKHFGKTQGSKEKHIESLRKLIPNMKPQALYFFLAAPASVLLHLAGVSGAVVHLYGNTGYGKTTVGRLAMALFGEPSESIISARDTINAAEAKLKALNVMPAVYDEFTPELMGAGAVQSVTNTLYSVTNGHGRDRATRTGELRSLDGRWQLIMLTTANKSISEIIAQGDKEAVREALRQRVIELETDGKDDFFLYGKGGDLYDASQTLEENYGFFGWSFVKFILKNREMLKSAIMRQVKALNKEYGIPSRFINATHACIRIVALLFNNALMEDLIDMSIIDSMRKQLHMKAAGDKEVVMEVDDPVGLLVDAMNVSGRSAVFIGNEDSDQLEYVGAPMDDVDIRVEVQGEEVDIWFTRPAFEKCMRTIGESGDALLNAMARSGYLITAGGRRLTFKEMTENVPDKTGILRRRPPARCYHFRMPSELIGY